MLKPIPSIEDVFNLVTQDERQKVLKPSTLLDNVAFQNFGHVAMTQNVPLGGSETGVYTGQSLYWTE